MIYELELGGSIDQSHNRPLQNHDIYHPNSYDSKLQPQWSIYQQSQHHSWQPQYYDMPSSHPVHSNSFCKQDVIAFVLFLARGTVWLNGLNGVLEKLNEMDLSLLEPLHHNLLEEFLLLANQLSPQSSDSSNLATAIMSLSFHHISSLINTMPSHKRSKGAIHMLLELFTNSASTAKVGNSYNQLCRPLVGKTSACNCEDSYVTHFDYIGIDTDDCDLASLLNGELMCPKCYDVNAVKYTFHTVPSILFIRVFHHNRASMDINKSMFITDVYGIQYKYALDSLVFYDPNLNCFATALYESDQLLRINVDGRYTRIRNGLFNRHIRKRTSYIRYVRVGYGTSVNINKYRLTSNVPGACHEDNSSRLEDGEIQDSDDDSYLHLSQRQCLTSSSNTTTVSSYQVVPKRCVYDLVDDTVNHTLSELATVDCGISNEIVLESGTVKRRRVAIKSIQSSGNIQQLQPSGSSSIVSFDSTTASTIVDKKPSLSDSIQQLQASNRELASRIQRYASQRVHPRLGNGSASDSSTAHSTQQQQQQSFSYKLLPGYKNMVCYIAKQETLSNCEPNIDDGMLHVACLNLRDINGVAASEQISKQLSQCHAIGFTEFSSEAYEEIKLLCGDSVTVLRNGRVGIAVSHSNTKSVVQVPIAIDEFVDVYGKNLSESVRTSIKADIHSRLALYELTLICGIKVHVAVFYYWSSWSAHINARRVFGKCIRHCLKKVQLHSLYIGIGDINSAAHWIDRYRLNILATTEEQHRNVQHYRSLLGDYKGENKHHIESVLEPLAEVGLYDPVHLARCFNMPTSSADIHHRFSLMKNNQPNSAIDCCFVPVHLLPECVISYGIGSGLWPYLDHLAIGVSISLKQADAIGTAPLINIPQSYFELPPIPQNHITIRRPINYMDTTTRFKFTIVNNSNSSLSMTSTVTRAATPHQHPPSNISDGLFLQGIGSGYSAVDSSSTYKALLANLEKHQQSAQQPSLSTLTSLIGSQQSVNKTKTKVINQHSVSVVAHKSMNADEFTAPQSDDSVKADAPLATARTVRNLCVHFSQDSVMAATFKQWLFKNVTTPYPTEDQREKLAEITGVEVDKVDKWFSYRRKMILAPIIQDILASQSTVATKVPAVYSVDPLPSVYSIATMMSERFNQMLRDRLTYISTIRGVEFLRFILQPQDYRSRAIKSGRKSTLLTSQS